MTESKSGHAERVQPSRSPDRGEPGHQGKQHTQTDRHAVLRLARASLSTHRSRSRHRSQGRC
jgi:hypothetical protein